MVFISKINLVSYIGEKFGTLIIIGVRYQKHTKTKLICECECGCGRILEVEYYSLVTGKTKSCKGYNRSKRKTSDELLLNKFKHTYHDAKRRCTSSKCTGYENYGGRGIKVEWNTFEEFMFDMYESYQAHVEEFGEKETTFDRIDVDGNYCKENCRWTTHLKQGNNTRRNHYITIDGITKTAKEWWRECGKVAYQTFISRINDFGWEPMKALTTPPKPIGNNVHKKD